MYFFYIDETGTRDPKVEKIKPDGTVRTLEHLYVLTAVGLYERKWHPFDRTITHLKLELADQLRRTRQRIFDLADCEVKSTWMRLPKLRAKESPFLDALSEADLLRITDRYYGCLEQFRMKMDGLKVFPDDTELVAFAGKNAEQYLKKEKPADAG